MDHDQQAALEWYEYAADNGLVVAQNNLGHLLLQGLEGVPPDAPAAMQLFQQAADQGSTAAWFNLGVCYELGLDGGKPDTAAAEACFKHAGTPQALLRLGLLYQQQHSTAASREALTAAAEAGSVEALLQLAKLQAGQLQGFTVPPSSNLKQLQQLPACFQTPSWGGCSSSGGSTLLQPAYIAGYWAGTSNSIGGLSGKGSPARPCSSLDACAGADAVLQLYQLAADAGSAEAQHVCGSVCWTRGVVDEAMKAWHAAASQGYGPALLCLAEAAENGLMGVKQDAAAARACYAMAAARGCQQAELQLSLMDREAALESSSWKFLSAAPHQAKVC
jgi:TPR repeat protein